MRPATAINDQLSRSRAALLGAVVADAASLGVHWIYDPEYIGQLSDGFNKGKGLEFFPPSKDVYEGKKGFYALAGKQTGDVSHYGAHFLCGVRTLAANNGEWKNSAFLTEFSSTFSAGGSWVGYIDGVTSGTIDNIKKDSAAVIEAAAKTSGLEGKFAMYFTKYTPKKAEEGICGQKLVEEIVKVYDMALKDEEGLKEAKEKVTVGVEYYEKHVTTTPGADDNQLPALCKLPAVVIANLGKEKFSETIEAAIRLTNDNDEAVAYGVYGAKVLEIVLQGQSTVADALTQALDILSSSGKGDDDNKRHYIEAKAKLEKGLAEESKNLTGPKLAEEFGMPCPLPMAMPLSAAVLNSNLSFADSIRLNSLAGGDNCGRAIIIGAILGAANGIGTANGVPLSWLSRVNNLTKITSDIEAAVPAPTA